MANPADDYYEKKVQEFYEVQRKKEREEPNRVALAKLFQEMKEAHHWYYERTY